MPANESFQMIEATKGINSYYLTSDGSTMSYRTRIRTPSYAHLQQIPAAIRGSLVSDLIVYLGSIDFVMSGCGPLIMHENQQPQTEAFELSAAEREAIEHEMHHYEDPRAASIEALKIVQKQRVAGCRMARSTRSPMCWVFRRATSVWQRFIARSSASRLAAM